MNFISVILISIFSTTFVSCTNETELFKHLLSTYEPLSRPGSSNFGNATIVEFGITLNQLIQVNEKSQILTSSIWLRLQWTDVDLQWNPSEFGNFKTVRIPITRIWNPDVRVYNTAEGHDSTRWQEDFNAVIAYTGNVVCVPSMVFKTSCKMDVTWFPFDLQTCELKFGSWTYNGAEVDLQFFPNGTEIDMSGFVTHGEWDVVQLKSERMVKTYECCPDDPYVSVSITIHIKRRSLYYFFNLIVPCGLIGFLAVLGFTLPPDSGEKLSLGVTVLFSIIVFLNMISVSMPANSDAIPLLGTYFNCVMVMIASSVVSTVIVNLNARKTSPVREITGKPKKILLEWLPKLLFITPLNEDNMIRENDSINSTNQEVLLELKESSQRSKSNNINETLIRQWKFAAIVVDRFCLFVSIIFTIISIIVLVASALK